MNTVDAPLFSPAPEWSGRSDGPGAEHARWHSVIAPLEASTSSAPAGAAVLGFASDEGVERNNGRQGAAAGPAAIRAALGSLAVHEDLVLYDAGTVTTQGTDLEGAHDALSSAVEDLISHGHLAIVLGGGHETAFGTHRGAWRALGEKSPQIVNIDAHFDLRSADRPTSGTPFKQIADMVDGFDYSVLGISKPNNTPILFTTAEELGTTVVLDEQLAEMTAAECAQMTAALLEADKPIHLSIDLDVLPADIAPGVSAPAAFGVSFDRVRAIALAIAHTGHLCLVDVVELNPEFDIDGRTAKVAARLINDIVVAHHHATH